MIWAKGPPKPIATSMAALPPLLLGRSEPMALSLEVGTMCASAASNQANALRMGEADERPKARVRRALMRDIKACVQLQLFRA
jgi:hypothetical protein